VRPRISSSSVEARLRRNIPLRFASFSAAEARRRGQSSASKLLRVTDGPGNAFAEVACMVHPVTNILRPFESKPETEVLETFVATDHFLFERVVSCGHASPPGMWVDQPRDEWIVLLSGEARLRFQTGDEVVDLKPGDAMKIPAHCRHRVDWTSPDHETVWLALHYDSADEDVDDLESVAN
jgi:cupin 2 domain-containing protein